jgi:hypothetical protein
MSYRMSILALAAATALLATQSDAAVKLNSSKSNAYRQEQNAQAGGRGSAKGTGVKSNARQGSSTGGSPAARATTVKSSKSKTSD